MLKEAGQSSGEVMDVSSFAEHLSFESIPCFTKGLTSKFTRCIYVRMYIGNVKVKVKQWSQKCRRQGN